MKRNYILFLILFITAVFVSSCELDEDSDSSDSTYTVTLTGSVVDASDGDNISGATIKLIYDLSVSGTTTDDEGEFLTEIEVTDDTDVTVIVAKSGYVSDTTSVFAIVSSTVEVPIFQLEIDDESSSSEIVSSGGAASINLYSQSASSIGVKESGDVESAELVFEVRDSSGVLIDDSHAVVVNFSFGAMPDGGEYLYPASSETNALAKASVTLNTGKVAGVVQVIAEATVDGNTIKSKPILIAIHGGFPTADLFYVACEKLNYPALGIIGESITFTAYAGDKYNNPVRPGTAIYFTANYGIIGGSDLTSESGTASVDLLTEPWPDDPVYGPGFFRVTAKTADEMHNTITTETVRLLSGAPSMGVSPSSFTLENGGTQSFTYTIADANGNPMSEGQTVDITVESEFVDVAGTTEVRFPDTQSKSWTAFSFIAFDTKPDTLYSEAVTIEIGTAGPNSDATIIVSGSAL